MPFINKAQGHCVRIHPLVETFGSPFFVRITRKPLQVAQSILHGRKEFFDDLCHWFSAKPKEIAWIDKSNPIKQICEQMYFLEKNIDEDIEELNVACYLVSYDELCRSPKKVVSEFIEQYYAKTEIKLMLRLSIPDSFKISQSRKVSDCELEEIVKCLDELF